MPEVPTVATSEAGGLGTVSELPTFNHATSTKEQHTEFHHLHSLLHLTTAYNYGESMLPDPDYAKNFDLEADKLYHQFTC
jgi:hypothetical protein